MSSRTPPLLLRYRTKKVQRFLKNFEIIQHLLVLIKSSKMIPGYLITFNDIFYNAAESPVTLHSYQGTSECGKN